VKVREVIKMNDQKEGRSLPVRQPWHAPRIVKLEAGSAEAAPFTPGSADTGTLS
jgi:hypothetical protein